MSSTHTSAQPQRLPIEVLLARARTCPDLMWLAGLLEGEGSFFPGSPSAPGLPVLQVAMVDEDVMKRVGAILGVKALRINQRRSDWKTAYAVRIRGAPAVAWMTALRPHLGARRRAQIDRALASYSPRSTQHLDDAAALRALDALAAGRSVRAVAEAFGVSVWCIYDLRLGRTHRYLRHPARRGEQAA